MPPKRKRPSKKDADTEEKAETTEKAGKEFKLSYFNGRGLAECSRLIFAHAGQDFEDKRYSLERGPKGEYIRAEWDSVKGDASKFPFHKMPTLEVEGVVIPQSKAIERFLAKRFKLLGRNDIDAAIIQSIVEQINDLRAEWRIRRAKPDAEKKEAIENYFTEYLPKELPQLELLLENSGTGFFKGKKISYADIAMYEWLGTFTENVAELDKAIEKFDRIKKLRTNVGEDEGIKAWVAKRPDTNF
jgi:glutathione S-transferase